MQVSICICTYRRNSVLDTIKSVLAQPNLRAIQAEIVVCDDDPARSAQAAIRQAAARAAVPILYLSSGASNVAAARNVCLAGACGRFIAFIDDDETCEPDWLSQLLLTQVNYGADVVKGFVRGVYPSGTPTWIRAGDPFTRDCGATGTPVVTMGTGNVLFNREFAMANKIKFNTDYGPLGIEDNDFFWRMGALGAKMVACREAVVNEIVPLNRVAPEYIRQRFRHFGRVHGSTTTNLLHGAKPVRSGILAAASVMSLWPLIFIGLEQGSPSWERLYCRCFTKFWYSVGTLEGIVRGRISERHR
jgi:succinoglycan biosynthesis protein ExoM